MKPEPTLHVIIPSIYGYKRTGLRNLVDLVLAHCYLGHFKKITNNNNNNNNRVR